MFTDHSYTLMAPYCGNNITGLIVTDTPTIVLHQIIGLTSGLHGAEYIRDTVQYKDIFKKRVIIYDAETKEELWIIQQKS